MDLNNWGNLNGWINMEVQPRYYLGVEQEAKNPTKKEIQVINENLKENPSYQPTEKDLEAVDAWLKEPDIYMNEGQLQKIYDYPSGTNWEFLLHALGFKTIPTPKERIEQGYDAFINGTSDFNDDQLKVLLKMKDIFATNVSNRQSIDLNQILANPIYEKILGKRENVMRIFAGKLDEVIIDMKDKLKLPKSK